MCCNGHCCHMSPSLSPRVPCLPLILFQVLSSSLGLPGGVGGQGAWKLRAPLCPVCSGILDKVFLRSCWLSQDPSCLRK